MERKNKSTYWVQYQYPKNRQQLVHTGSVIAKSLDVAKEFVLATVKKSKILDAGEFSNGQETAAQYDLSHGYPCYLGASGLAIFDPKWLKTWPEHWRFDEPE
jgi:hypothetical protein